jgi:segregation and condensation protein A
MSTRAFITGLSGLQLRTDERAFLRAERPWGFILFKRNIETPAQVSALVTELRESIGEPDAPVLIDQEGGRVARLGPPHWPVYPHGAAFGTLYDIDRALGLSAARLSARLIAADLTDLGITVDCLPLADDEPALVVDVEGYEGPLDLLLALARQQKVDLAKISILALADQYLVFIEAARKIRLELAADYLVMAAWLAFLKSRLLLPEPATPDGPSAEEMATALANRLRRLEAIREACNRLMTRPQLQRDIFPRGQPEAIAEIKHPKFTATLFDLLTAYAAQRQSRVLATVHLAKRTVWSLSEARATLERLVGIAEEWSRLDEYLLAYVVDPSQKATVFASSFAAALELVREGTMDLNQKDAFAPLYFRKRSAHSASEAMAAPEAPVE